MTKTLEFTMGYCLLSEKRPSFVYIACSMGGSKIAWPKGKCCLELASGNEPYTTAFQDASLSISTPT